MKPTSTRRSFVRHLAAAPLFAAGLSPVREAAGPPPFHQTGNLKSSLNAYSFNAPLSEGKMTLDDLIDFCSRLGFSGLDITAYYFPGYPEVPADDFLYDIKRKAFRAGLEISGTGVRNDFTHADKARRQESIQLVKNWILAAEKLGAPVIRVFAGNQPHPDHSWEEVATWMVDDLKECVAFGKEHGVMIGLQNHADFVQTAAHVKTILEAVDSEWIGLILDTGSYRKEDPYQAIAETIPYAINWQVKEKIFVNGEEVDIDLARLMRIIRSSGYKGYLPIETLGPGDPYSKVEAFFRKVQKAMK